MKIRNQDKKKSKEQEGSISSGSMSHIWKKCSIKSTKKIKEHVVADITLRLMVSDQDPDRKFVNMDFIDDGGDSHRFVMDYMSWLSFVRTSQKFVEDSSKMGAKPSSF